MTEHSAVIFVFFFLAEYASIVLICILSSILFLGGYLLDISPLINLVQFVDFDRWLYLTDSVTNGYSVSNPVLEGLFYGIVLGVKSCALIFTFVWARASFPRIRFDQLMSFCWTVLLPIVIAFIVLVPCVLYSFEIIPANISLLSLPILVKGVDNNPQTKHIKKLNPHWVTGFTDGEGCFTVKLRKSSLYTVGWRVQAVFAIKLHKRDLDILTRIREFFGVGTVIVNKTEAIFAVHSLKEIIKIIIPHFDSYPLLTQKYADFLLFKQIVLIMAEKKHTTEEGLREILSIRAALNLGFSDTLKKFFSKIVPASRPVVPIRNIIDPNWLVGFVDAEGCFHIVIQKAKLSFKVWSIFQITQHSRDTLLMESLVQFLGCGKVSNRNSTPTVDLRVTELITIYTNIVPFFQKYELQSLKQFDFNLFCEAFNLIRNKEHYTKEGLDKLMNIKLKMNKKDI